MKVLVTGGGGAGSEALWRQLEGQYEMHFADSDTIRVHPSIPRSRVHRVPVATDTDFAPVVFELCGSLGIKALIPSVDEELMPLSTTPEPDRHGTTLLLAPGSFVSEMLDKSLCMKALATAGIRTPQTTTLDAVADWRSFPAIVKPRHGRGSRDLSFVTDRYELDATAALHERRRGEYLVQEALHGSEYTVQVISNRASELIAVVPVLVHRKRGITLSAVIEPHAEVESVCVAFHQEFRPEAIANVQGILGTDGVFRVFEVNPRVSTTLCLAIAAGVDPIAAYLDEVPPIATSSLRHVSLDRFWYNYFTIDMG